VAGMLALVGIVVGLYFALSSGSGGQARLLVAPAVTTAAAAAEQRSSTSASSTQATSTSAPTSGPSTTSPSSPSRPPVPAVAPQPVSAHVAAPSQVGEQHAVAATIHRHFLLIEQHHFSAAYALLAPSLQSGESSWIASHREDGIYNVSLTVEATVHSAASATARIAKMTTLDGHGCKNWSGSWGLTKIAGQWRISQANISSNPC
jgi:hypothetical protein